MERAIELLHGIADILATPQPESIAVTPEWANITKKDINYRKYYRENASRYFRNPVPNAYLSNEYVQGFYEGMEPVQQQLLEKEAWIKDRVAYAENMERRTLEMKRELEQQAGGRLEDVQHTLIKLQRRVDASDEIFEQRLKDLKIQKELYKQRAEEAEGRIKRQEWNHKQEIRNYESSIQSLTAQVGNLQLIVTQLEDKLNAKNE